MNSAREEHRLENHGSSRLDKAPSCKAHGNGPPPRTQGLKRPFTLSEQGVGGLGEGGKGVKGKRSGQRTREVSLLGTPNRLTTPSVPPRIVSNKPRTAEVVSSRTHHGRHLVCIRRPMMKVEYEHCTNDARCHHEHNTVKVRACREHEGALEEVREGAR